MSEQNKALARRNFEEIWNQGKVELMDELTAPNCVFNDPNLPGGKAIGPESVKQSVHMYRTAFPDVHFTVNDQIAEGDKVVTRWTATGTHKAALMSIPATGMRGTMTGMTISRYQNGKLVELWESADMLGMLQQLGVVPRLVPASLSQ